ncbi:MAG: NAD(+) synthase [Cytophagaceae bacterium]|nr:NAD(+) synthase [Cytophagaceae bacterium]
MSFIKIAGAALNQTPMDWNSNSANIIAAIEEAKKQKVKILCLPELSICGYGCEDLFLSEWLPEKCVDILLQLKEYCDGIIVSFGLPVRYKGKLYNCGCLIQNKNILGLTAKQHLAKDGVHYEPRWFTPWQFNKKDKITIGGQEYDFGDITYELEGIKIGYEICEDAWVADELRPAKRHCEKKIDLILNPSASHFSFAKSEFRYKLIVGSSEKFNCTYLYANLLGNEAGRIIYDGEVLIARNGKLIQRNDRLSYHNVDLIPAEINFKTGEVSSEKLLPDLREKEYEFWESTTLALYDYLRKSKSKGFVLSLSGGADSSACAVMVSEMVKRGIQEVGVVEFIKKANILQSENIAELKKLSVEQQAKTILSRILICAYQGTKNSSKDTYNSAKELAESVGATFYYWTIDEEVISYTEKIEKAIGRKLTWEKDDISLQNIQARTRSPIIWMLANINQFLLITTSNRSEGDVGYATMDGDTSGSIAPIAGVDKYFIQSWLKWAEKNLNQPGLQHVNALTPTAELRPLERSQTDEKDLMPYKILAAIEREAIRNHKSPIEIYNILKEKNIEDNPLLKKHIKLFFTLWSRNQWKRERIAPSFHIDDFNVDPRSWCRFPILSGSFDNELKELENFK